jgi:ankyrin repeat protein
MGPSKRREDSYSLREFIMKKLLLTLGLITGTSSLFAGTIHDAVRTDNMDELIKELNNGADINSGDDNGLTPLHISTFLGYYDIASKLVVEGADINAVHYHKYYIQTETGLNRGNYIDNINKVSKGYKTTALQVALKFNMKDFVDLFLSNNADLNNLISENVRINSKNRFGYTLLHNSIFWGNSNIVKFFIGKGADINIKDPNGFSPLHLAIKKGNNEIIEILIKAGADPSIKDGITGLMTPLKLALKSKAILETVDPNNTLRESIFIEPKNIFEAIEYGGIDNVNKFILSGVELNERFQQCGCDDDRIGMTPLHFAALYGHYDITELLIKKGAKLNLSKDDKNFMFMGSKAYGLWPTMEGGTPLYYASKYDNKDIIELLIKNGADVNTVIESGIVALTALDIAIYTNSENAIDMLSRYNAKTNAELSLFGAVQSGSNYWVDKHLSKGSNPNIHISTSNQAAEMPILHYALAYGFNDISKSLVNYGSDIDSKGILSMTPTHYAAWRGYANIVQTLIKKGASFDALNEQGLSPMHFAAGYNSPEIVKFFPETLHEVNNSSDYIETLKTLISSGANINNKGGKLDEFLGGLIFSTEGVGAGFTNGYLDLSNEEADPTLNSGSTPLHYASHGMNGDIIKLLVESGAEINFLDQNGQTPLELFRDVKTTKFDIQNKINLEYFLLLHGAKSKNQIKEINKSLHKSASNGYINNIKTLLENGADINLLDENGRTPLHNALQYGQIDVVLTLIKRGADLNIITNNGQTALDISDMPILRVNGAKKGRELKQFTYLKLKSRTPLSFNFISLKDINYIIECSPNLKDWTAIQAIKGNGEKLAFADSRKDFFQKQYYRVKLADE